MNYARLTAQSHREALVCLFLRGQSSRGQLFQDEESSGQLAAKLEALQLEAKSLKAAIKKKQDAYDRLRALPKNSESRKGNASNGDKQRDGQALDARFELQQTCLKFARVRGQVSAQHKTTCGHKFAI